LNAQCFKDFDPVRPLPAPLRSVNPPSRKTSTGLSPGTQAKLIDAAVIAQRTGRPINRLTTIRTEMLVGLSVGGVFLGDHEADAVKNFIELLRKWNTGRAIPWACIWSRERGEKIGSHLHLATHSDDSHDQAYCNQMAAWTGEKMAVRKSHDKGVIAISEHQSWQVKHCTRQNLSGVDIAIYLSKDEPNTVPGAYGKTPLNKKKRMMIHEVGCGYIEGLIAHEYRHGISKGLAPTSQAGRRILATVSDDERKIGIFDWLPY